MFSSSRTKYPPDSFSKHRAGKSTSSKSKRSFKEHRSSRGPADLDLSFSKSSFSSRSQAPLLGPTQAQLNSATITISVGTSPARLFAAHIDILNASPQFSRLLHSQYYNTSSRQLHLPSEIPEVFSSILEYLYKSDYAPKLEFDARRTKWSIDSTSNADTTIWIPISSHNNTSSSSSSAAAAAAAFAPAMSPTGLMPHPTNPSAGRGVYILKDTAVYCAAERYSLPALKRIALRKQGLQSGIPVATILASAKFAYAHTPESDRHLRAHYLALIIRSRNTFKRSGTMQVEMGMASPRVGAGGGSAAAAARGAGGSMAMDAGAGAGTGSTGLWFDLFVAMCNHLDDLEQTIKSPR